MLKPLLALLVLSATIPAYAQDKTSMEMLTANASLYSGAQLSADFNEDGKPDLASGYGVSLGNGDGTFQAPLLFTQSSAALNDLSAVDVDGDGHIDLVGVQYQTNGSGNTVTAVAIYFGNGDGTFHAGPTFLPPSGVGINSVAIADFNGDKLQDIAVGESNGAVVVYRNEGNRSFQPVTNYSLSDPVETVRAGDFDSDGHVDLAVVTPNSSYVLWGDGVGFQQQLLKTYSGITKLTVSVGDVNLDGNPDILVGVNCGQAPPVGRQGSICLTMDTWYGGQGYRKTLYRNIATNLAFEVYTVKTVDVNGDGIGDIVATGRDSSGIDAGIFFFLGHPDGTFDKVPQRFISNSDSVGEVVMGDFNRDGKMDFVTEAGGGATVQIYLNATNKPACATSAINGVVTMCTAANNSYFPSPVPIQANAFDSSPIVSLKEYVDNNLAFSTTSKAFSVAETFPSGPHHFVTKATDKKGAVSFASAHFTVYQGTPGAVCSTPASTATICLPATPTAHSPLHILANSNTSQIPTAVQLYVDGKLLINQNTTGTSAIDTTETLAPGSHSLVFKLYDQNGKVTSTSKNITIN